MRRYYFLFILILAGINISLKAAQPFRYLVARDGSGTHTSIQAAINDCPDQERCLIFIKNGTYEEKITIGTNKESSNKLISLIGESAEGVVITSSDMMTNENGFTWLDVVTAQLYSQDFYAENITFQNAAGIGGQALALHNGADRQTFKNCRLLGHQDTHRSKKGVRCYFKDSWIEGTVDFIYAGGVIFFDDCTINCVNGGGYIAAPEDCIAAISKANTETNIFIRLGFFFRDCLITANNDVTDGSFYLGRPWKEQAGAYYLNCRMGNHIKPQGWQTWNGNEKTASFCEYQSMDLEGKLLDTSNRVSWSYQLAQRDVENLLTPEYIYDYVKSYHGNIAYDPVSISKDPDQPAQLRANGTSLSWNAVTDVAGYLLFKDGKFIGATTETTFIDTTAGTGEYSIRTMSPMGSLSKPLKAGNTTAVSNITVLEKEISVNGRTIAWDGVLDAQLYNLTGEIIYRSKGETISLPAGVSTGVYILRLTDGDMNKCIKKINIQ